MYVEFIILSAIHPTYMKMCTHKAIHACIEISIYQYFSI